MTDENVNGATKKYAMFLDCGSYKCRMTPFFDTVAKIEDWVKEAENHLGKIEGDTCIRPVSNWREVIDNRNPYNCDEIVPIGE